jgi:hypothetical protein
LSEIVKIQVYINIILPTVVIGVKETTWGSRVLGRIFGLERVEMTGG